jgi:hypothetical protein
LHQSWKRFSARRALQKHHEISNLLQLHKAQAKNRRFAETLGSLHTL